MSKLIEHDLFEASDGDTILCEEEKLGLIPSWVTTRGDLNAAEQQNIVEAERWLFGRKRAEILSEKLIRQLHKKMFASVWQWAGQFRSTEKNIGVAPWRVAPDLKILLDDTRFWIENGTYPPDEISTRFHHRLVQIHLFPNGNGRHARLFTDYLATHLGQPRFSWGRNLRQPIEEIRKQYITAVREADNARIQSLLAFVRS